MEAEEPTPDQPSTDSQSPTPAEESSPKPAPEAATPEEKAPVAEKAEVEKPADESEPKESPAAETSPEAESEPQPMKSRKKLWATLGTVFGLVGVGTTALVFSLPSIIRSQIEKQLAAQDWDRTEFEVAEVTLDHVLINQIDFADSGWEATANSLRVDYSLGSLIKGRANQAAIDGLKVNLDLDALEAEAEKTDAAESEPLTLSSLANSLPVDLIDLGTATLSATRGEVVQNLELKGQLAWDGPVDFTATGSGVSDLDLKLSGSTKATSGNAELAADLTANKPSDLLEHFTPGWSEGLGESFVLKLGETNLSASLTGKKDIWSISQIEGQIAVEEYVHNDAAFRNSMLTATQTGSEAKVHASTSPIDFAYADTVTAKGTIEADFSLGDSLEKTLVSGMIKTSELTVFGIPVAAIELPVSGNLEDLDFQHPAVNSPDYADYALSEIVGGVHGIGTDVIRTFGAGKLAVRTDPGFDIPLDLEFLTKTEAIDFTLKARLSKTDEPLVIETGEFSYGGVGNAIWAGTLGEEKLEALTAKLEIPKFSLSRNGNEAITLTNFKIDGELKDDVFDLNGGGKLNGQDLPFTASHKLNLDADPWTADGSSELGPIKFEDATWPGILVDALQGVELNATAEAGGTIQVIGKEEMEIKPDIGAKISSGEIIYPGNIVAEGVSASVRFFAPNSLTFEPQIELKIAKVETDPDVNLSDLVLAFKIDDDGAFRVSKMSARLLGGRLLLAKPTTIPADRKNFTATLSLRQIQARQLLALIPDFDADIDASITGQIPMRFRNGKLSLMASTLKLDKSRAATVSYPADGLLTEGLKKRSRAYRVNKKVEEALGDLGISELEVRILDPNTPDVPIFVRLEGSASDVSLNAPPVNLNLRTDQGIYDLMLYGMQYFADRVLSIQFD